jgi:hypothetical protein
VFCAHVVSHEVGTVREPSTHVTAKVIVGVGVAVTVLVCVRTADRVAVCELVGVGVLDLVLVAVSVCVLVTDAVPVSLADGVTEALRVCVLVNVRLEEIVVGAPAAAGAKPSSTPATARARASASTRHRAAADRRGGRGRAGGMARGRAARRRRQNALQRRRDGEGARVASNMARTYCCAVTVVAFPTPMQTNAPGWVPATRETPRFRVPLREADFGGARLTVWA